jgi:hypothetical protein
MDFLVEYSMILPAKFFPERISKKTIPKLFNLEYFYKYPKQSCRDYFADCWIKSEINHLKNNLQRQYKLTTFQNNLPETILRDYINKKLI